MNKHDWLKIDLLHCTTKCTEQATRIEALKAALRPFAVRAAGWQALIAKMSDRQLREATATITIQMSDLATAHTALREPGAGVSTDGEGE